MITLVQRVLRASVTVEGRTIGAIEKGLLLFVGVERGDGEADAVTTAQKVAALRIFPGRHPMDVNLRDVDGECLVISQFTLAGQIHKGNRPSFDRAEKPDEANRLYELVAQSLEKQGITVATGQFAADMKVELVNDGPVTFIVETKNGQLFKS
jgi:D-tyrosyl-tRNA(Tyr) deacylase